MSISGRSDKGRKRKKNEDSFAFDKKLGIMIVADGIGGQAHGEVASQLATKLCIDQLKRALRTGHVPVFHHVKPQEQLDKRSLLLGDCVKFSNQSVYEAGQIYEDKKNMGTTIVAALWLDGKLAVAHVGDSRLYIYRDGNLLQCTRDHSFVQDQVDKGLISEEDAEKSDMKNMLTRSIGGSADVAVDVQEFDMAVGDYVLLCSDGLTKMVSDKDIESVFNNMTDPNQISEDLIDRANAAGGNDNVTVIVGKVESMTGWGSLTRKFKDMFSTSEKGKAA